jgi:cytochrome c-type biogenesis protein CcmH
MNELSKLCSQTWFYCIQILQATFLIVVCSIFFSSLLLVTSSKAVEPDEILQNVELELRARNISSNLRCLVCQNQSIDDSDAPLARDLRILVRERLVSGDTDKDVIDYIVSRYGEFVLLSPPFKPITYLLWLGPAIILIFAFVYLWSFYRQCKVISFAEKDELTIEEKKKLDKLIARRTK